MKLKAVRSIYSAIVVGLAYSGAASAAINGFVFRDFNSERPNLGLLASPFASTELAPVPALCVQPRPVHRTAPTRY
jgi:hypothetical protein